MTNANECTCPSGDGSLRHPCPAHERAAFELFVRKHCGMPEHIAVNWDAKFTNDAWEGWQARATLAQPSPVRSSLLINGYQLRDALEFIAPDGTAEQLESEARIEWRQQDADFLEAGLYAWCAEYPEEGCVLLDEEPATAQPSPASDLDPLNLAPHTKAFNEAPAEALKPGQAERPEVVAWRYGFSGGIVSDKACLDEWKSGGEYQSLMTVAQHERIVGELRFERQQMYRAFTACINERDAANARLHEVATACATAEQERDAALARVAELEKREPAGVPMPDEIHQMAFEEGQPADDGDGYLFSAEEFDLFVQRLLDSCAAPPAQAQHSVPEEFSFEYRHPNGECHTVTVSREQVINEMPDFLFEALRSKFCNCEPVGETNVVECCCDEYAEEFKLIAAAPGKEG